MTDDELETAILRELRREPSDFIALSCQLDESPIRVHAVLKKLEREGKAVQGRALPWPWTVTGGRP